MNPIYYAVYECLPILVFMRVRIRLGNTSATNEQNCNKDQIEDNTLWNSFKDE